MATKRSQRIIIWIIAIFMAFGTIGSFVAIIFQNDNAQTDQARLNQLMSEYQKEVDDYEAKQKEQANELSDKYFDAFKQYEDLPSEWSADDASELKKEDIVVGDGEEIKEDEAFTAYYIGWTPDGKVFDSSFKDGKLDTPFTAFPGGAIKGWLQGVPGMKVGGVRELTIPSELGYGESGSGSIPPNTPLKFIVFVIPTPDTIPQPQPSDELLRLYSQSR